MGSPGAITFDKPGRGTVTGDIDLDPAVIDEIRDVTADGENCCAGSNA